MSFLKNGYVNYSAIFDTSAEQSEAHVLKGCIKNGSIVKLHNKVLIIRNLCDCVLPLVRLSQIALFWILDHSE